MKKERIKVLTKDHIQKCSMHNGEPWEQKTQNLGPNPITSSTKQVMQGDGQENMEGHRA
jgi:hypothetical protein